MVHNDHVGFQMTTVWVAITLIAVVVVAWKKYYLHQDCKGGWLIVNDIADSKMNEFVIVSSVMLFVIMMMESWYPIIVVMQGVKWPALYYTLTFLVIVMVSVIHNASLRCVANVVMKLRKALLEKRKNSIVKSRERRHEVKVLCEMVEFPD